MDRKAADAIAGALMRPLGMSLAGELGIYPHDRATAAALVALLADASVVEWDGDSGIPRRSYQGTLPSGLRLDIVTDRDLVEEIELS